MGITGFVTSVADVLNIWNNIGVFSYILPFLLIFAVVFAIIEKTNLLGGAERKNKALEAIVAAAIGLMALQFDIVPEFFAIVFPRFGVGLSVFLVLLIFIAFFFPEVADSKKNGPTFWIGILVAVVVVLWTLNEWSYYGGRAFGDFSRYFVSENIWALLILIGVGAIIAVVAGSGKTTK